MIPYEKKRIILGMNRVVCGYWGGSIEDIWCVKYTQFRCENAWQFIKKFLTNVAHRSLSKAKNCRFRLVCRVTRTTRFIPQIHSRLSVFENDLREQCHRERKWWQFRILIFRFSANISKLMIKLWLFNSKEHDKKTGNLYFKFMKLNFFHWYK